MAQGTELFDGVAQAAVRRYSFKDDVAQLLTFSENYTYLIIDSQTGAKDGVLRVSRPGYHTLLELESEMDWLRQINDYTPLLVANPLPALDGSYIQQIESSSGETCYCVICEFLEGEAPDENDAERLVGYFSQLGETTAYLHRQTEIWNGAARLDRISWDYDHIIGSQGAWGPWQDFEGLTQDDRADLTRCCDVIKGRLDRYGKTSHNYGLIHADLRLANLIVDRGQVKVIDFDDCGFGWRLHDLASALSFIETSDQVAALVNAWLDGYRNVLPFTDTDFEEIDTFIMMRRLQLTAWLASHSQSDPVKELCEGWAEGTMQLATRYLRMFG